ncbi:AcrR family transcriptional regulator [Streptosporangium becharense]|uniref:AcrR family transcriptional regulator n=1 Tax=Streptosporangium becharense TaxID=1816182 RepID=A0A7W9MJG6_9ACTN|nr:TetR/AcrR family transcriptional regulator [Streptosporangium becharense]MBB2911673.1 AcrR family transcriptional regulator [Streptosporangium becharense]MBB5822509.1 AcrR family transcriptional regulator [Streptosporangium becharense]
MDETRQRDREGTRRRILDAARDLFAELGYDQVTMRLIAAEAGANVALINRYFGSKRELFAEVLAAQGRFPGILDGPPEELSRRLAEYVADRLSSERASPVMAALISSSSCPEIHEIIRDRVSSAILEPLAARLPGPDAVFRAAVATALITGSGTLRQLYGADGVAVPGREVVVARLETVFEACLRA